MYYVLNPDGNRYGPVSHGVLQQWYREGRILDNARFLDAATEEPVSRERLLPPAVAQYPYNPPSPGYTGTPHNPYGQGYQGQAYRDAPVSQQPRLYDAPHGYNYPPNPYLTGQYVTGNPNHNPVTACLLTFLCTIAGYLYNKQAAKGILFLIIGGVIGYFLGWGSIIWTVFCMIDCYKIAQRIQRGESVGDFQTF